MSRLVFKDSTLVRGFFAVSLLLVTSQSPTYGEQSLLRLGIRSHTCRILENNRGSEGVVRHCSQRALPLTEPSMEDSRGNGRD